MISETLAGRESRRSPSWHSAGVADQPPSRSATVHIRRTGSPAPGWSTEARTGARATQRRKLPFMTTDRSAHTPDTVPMVLARCSSIKVNRGSIPPVGQLRRSSRPFASVRQGRLATASMESRVEMHGGIRRSRSQRMAHTQSWAMSDCRGNRGRKARQRSDSPCAAAEGPRTSRFATGHIGASDSGIQTADVWTLISAVPVSVSASRNYSAARRRRKIQRAAAARVGKPSTPARTPAMVAGHEKSHGRSWR